jgi:26S proteasome regulatory subunit T3
MIENEFYWFPFRYVVMAKDFEKGWKEHVKKKDRDFDFYSL